MKTSRFIPTVLILAAMTVSSGTVYAQEKTAKEKEKELQMQEAIDAQKKAIVEQQKSQQELQKLLEEQNVNIDEALKKAQENMPDMQEFNRAFRIYDGSRNSGRTYTGEPFIFAPGADWYGHFGEDTERTNWDFSKSIKEGTFKRDYTFDVDASVKTVVMSVNGDCKAGDIRIKITMPNGKIYSDIVIDEFGNLNWRKSFNISETENKDKTGAWIFDVSATKATGYFKISLQAY